MLTSPYNNKRSLMPLHLNDSHSFIAMTLQKLPVVHFYAFLKQT